MFQYRSDGWLSMLFVGYLLCSVWKVLYFLALYYQKSLIVYTPTTTIDLQHLHPRKSMEFIAIRVVGSDYKYTTTVQKRNHHLLKSTERITNAQHNII